MALVVSAVISRILLPHKSSWLSRFSWFVHNVHSESKAEDARKNVLGIQMLSFGLHRQLFGSDEVNVSASDVKKSIDHLKMHDLWGKETSVLPDVNFQLPKLFGNNLDEHFQHIARQQSEKYTELALMLASTSLPPVPTHWHFDVSKSAPYCCIN